MDGHTNKQTDTQSCYSQSEVLELRLRTKGGQWQAVRNVDELLTVTVHTHTHTDSHRQTDTEQQTTANSKVLTLLRDPGRQEALTWNTKKATISIRCCVSVR